MTPPGTSTSEEVPGGTGRTIVDGQRVHYQRAGTEGPPVVLLHGGGVDESTLTWKATIGQLAEDYRVYAPDWPGYGASEALAGEHSNGRYVDVLRSFLDAVGLDSATLVGMSMGGAAALGVALAAPERVDRLGLVDSYGLGRVVPAGSFWYTMARAPGTELGWSTLGFTDALTRTYLSNVVHDAGNVPPDFVDDVRAAAQRPGAGAAFTAYVRNEVSPGGRARTDYSDDLGELAAPTFLVHGRQDPLFPVRWAERAHERIPDSSLTIVEDCGHWTPREQPERFAAILDEELD